MPYIKKERRLSASVCPTTAGELNYAITREILRYFPQDPGYDDYNEVIGVLECVKLEFVRRMLVPYEDQKILENGDVYPR